MPFIIPGGAGGIDAGGGGGAVCAVLVPHPGPQRAQGLRGAACILPDHQTRGHRC